MTHNFTNKAILCHTWQQMLHLAELAGKQGNWTDNDIFCEKDFNAGMVYFVVEDGRFGNVAEYHLLNWPQFVYSDFISSTKSDYTTFITPPTDDSVYGC